MRKPNPNPSKKKLTAKEVILGGTVIAIGIYAYIKTAEKAGDVLLGAVLGAPSDLP